MKTLKKYWIVIALGILAVIAGIIGWFKYIRISPPATAESGSDGFTPVKDDPAQSIYRGMKDAASGGGIERLQKKLNDVLAAKKLTFYVKDYGKTYNSLTPDGKFGAATEAALFKVTKAYKILIGDISKIA